MDLAQAPPNASHLRDSAGIRLKDAEYSTEYILALRNWMKTSNENARFEDQLIKGGFVSLDFDKFQLGLDFILESTGPKEDMEFESGSIRYAALDPIDQIPKRLRNESLREQKRERYVASMGLSAMDLTEACTLGAWTEFGVKNPSLRVFRIPEPPYSEFCRNKPPTLSISHLRALREDGYFDGRELDVQIAAYLISKGHWQKYQIETFFDHVITWEKFLSAQSKVHHHIQKTMPDRLKRLGAAREQLSAKQQLAFDTRFDVDLAPTIERTAAILKIARSSLNERLTRVRAQYRLAFEEFKDIIRRPLTWSRACDLQDGGFYRKSKGLLKSSPLIRADGTKYFALESRHIDQNVYTFEESKHILDCLRQRIYPPELKTIVGCANRGGYQVRRGDFFHHVEERRMTELWKKLYYLTEYSAEEVRVFTTGLMRRDISGESIFAVRHRLRLIRERLKQRGHLAGPAARRPFERSDVKPPAPPLQVTRSHQVAAL